MNRTSADREQVACELSVYVNGHQRIFAVNERTDQLFGLKCRNTPEDGCTVEPCQSFPRSIARIFIVNNEGDVIKIVRGGVSEVKKRAQGRPDQNEPACLIALQRK